MHQFIFPARLEEFGALSAGKVASDPKFSGGRVRNMRRDAGQSRENPCFFHCYPLRLVRVDCVVSHPFGPIRQCPVLRKKAREFRRFATATCTRRPESRRFRPIRRADRASVSGRVFRMSGFHARYAGGSKGHIDSPATSTRFTS